jgi:flagellar basal body-associated protein FliL
MLLFAAEPAFYETLAQILPVFLLVMAIGEARLPRRRPGEGKEDLKVNIFLSIAMILFVVAGEVASLRAVAEGDASEAEHAFATAGFAAGLVYVVMWMIRSGLDEYRDDFSPAARKRQLRLTIILTLLIVVGIFAALGK